MSVNSSLVDTVQCLKLHIRLDLKHDNELEEGYTSYCSSGLDNWYSDSNQPISFDVVFEGPEQHLIARYSVDLQFLPRDKEEILNPSRILHKSMIRDYRRHHSMSRLGHHISNNHIATSYMVNHSSPPIRRNANLTVRINLQSVPLQSPNISGACDFSTPIQRPFFLAQRTKVATAVVQSDTTLGLEWKSANDR